MIEFALCRIISDKNQLFERLRGCREAGTAHLEGQRVEHPGNLRPDRRRAPRRVHLAQQGHLQEIVILSLFIITLHIDFSRQYYKNHFKGPPRLQGGLPTLTG